MATGAVRRFSANAGRFRDRFVTLSWLSTIRSRLYLAFGLTAGMTVVGSLFALLASTSISATLSEIASRSMPATVESFRLSEDTGRLIATAPRLMSVADENHRAEIAAEITAQSHSLEARIARLRALDASENDEIAVARAAMADASIRLTMPSPTASEFPSNAARSPSRCAKPMKICSKP